MITKRGQKYDSYNKDKNLEIKVKNSWKIDPIKKKTPIQHLITNFNHYTYNQ